MSLRELSNRLKNWRAERPDEWTMDEFIRLAQALEHKSERDAEELTSLRARVAELESAVKESLTTGAAAPAAQPVPKNCPTCGTHEVSLEMTCHNSACRDYADQRNVYAGWKQSTPAAQAAQPVSDAYKSGGQAVADDVVRDARLGRRLYVWDYENPEDGTWENIEEFLHDTTPDVGETVRLSLAAPLDDVEVEMLEVGECGEPIRWAVRDAKTDALLAAQQQKAGGE